MTKSLIIVAGMLAAVASSAATAAPLGGLTTGGSGFATEESLVVQIHDGNRHRACALGVRGWHYHSYRGDRIECRPRRPLGFNWVWRDFEGRRGWYHSRDRRWN